MLKYILEPTWFAIKYCFMVLVVVVAFTIIAAVLLIKLLFMGIWDFKAVVKLLKDSKRFATYDNGSIDVMKLIFFAIGGKQDMVSASEHRDTQERIKRAEESKSEPRRQQVWVTTHGRAPGYAD